MIKIYYKEVLAYLEKQQRLLEQREKLNQASLLLHTVPYTYFI